MMSYIKIHINTYTNTYKYISVQKYRDHTVVNWWGDFRSQFFTLLEVWGGCELGCWTTVLDTKTSPCDGTGSPNGDRLGARKNSSGRQTY
jgi:hypothetical protein